MTDQDIIKQFREKFITVDGGFFIKRGENFDEIEQFILTTLNQRDEELLGEIRKMQKRFQPDDAVRLFLDPTAVDGYNKAISDIEALLNKNK